MKMKFLRLLTSIFILFAIQNYHYHENDNKFAETEIDVFSEAIHSIEGKKSNAQQNEMLDSSIFNELNEGNVTNKQMFEDKSLAEILMINKVTGNSKLIKLRINDPVFYGNIEIVINRCLKSLNQYQNWSYAFTKIRETKVDDDPVTILNKWIISSNLPISYLEHPIYEIILSKCID